MFFAVRKINGLKTFFAVRKINAFQDVLCGLQD